MPNATISRVEFSLSWTTPYPSLLDSASGRLVTRSAYAKAVTARGTDSCLPWESYGAQHWSRFWAYYLAAPSELRKGTLTADAAWDYVVPLQWLHNKTVIAPGGVIAQADVYVYPAAISVLVRATASGAWPLDKLAASIAGIRDAKSWGLSGPTSASSGRNLIGIAEDLRAEAEVFLTGGTPADIGAQVALSVAGPTAGSGPPASFDLGNVQAASCLVGLSVLGPPGTLVPARLFDANSDPRRGGRVYALDEGHAVWNPETFLGDPASDRLACLVANHTDLVTQVATLNGIASWAGERLAQRAPIPQPVQRLVSRAALRLSQLHDGRKEKSYRSEIAKVRIEPLVSTLATIQAVFPP